jgi:tetratricopeptide (TPR) repeat protein
MFLGSRRWKTAKEKRAADAVSELPTFGHAYRVAFDYAARIFGFGTFSPRQLLVSDRADAVRICSEYVTEVLRQHSVTLIVRETQHCDLDSLRLLLSLSERGFSPNLIFEYTTARGTFEPEHQKLFLRTADARGSLDILDLVRLEPGHLEYLIRYNVKADFHLTSDFYLAWSGDLRSVVELKYQVSIGRHISDPAQIKMVLSDLRTSLEKHLTQLSSQERMILALAVAHIEAIDHRVLLDVFSAIDPRTTPRVVDQFLDELVGRHGFLAKAGPSYSIQNDSIANALREATAIRPLIALAEKALRDYYTAKVDKSQAAGEPIAAAVRQVFRLCAKTKDVGGLLRATETLTERVNRSQDQAVYVEVVASAIEADSDLYKSDHDELIIWAASLAYEICDWHLCERLLAVMKSQDTFSLAMRACSLQEIGRHEVALDLVAEIRSQAIHSDEHLVADLIECIVVGCRGEQEMARSMLLALIDNPSNRNSPLIGYGYRFFEVIEGYVECLKMLKASVAWFDRFGFEKSRAYSQLPTAMLAARLGDVDGACKLIADAERTLIGQVRDQHMILNNAAAIELLRDKPDFADARDRLVAALRLARDDYTELTILTNLALTYWGLSDIGLALECVEKSLRILRNHDFEDKDIYWPVCFDAAQIFRSAGMGSRSDEVLRFPDEHGRPVSVNQGYWNYRYGQVATIEPDYEFLASCPRHPLYLSHWTIDVDGLNLLRRVRLQ